MAKKARFFKLTFRDGYGDHDHFFPAQSVNDLNNRLNYPETVQLIATEHVGWLNVVVGVDEHIEHVRFIAQAEFGPIFFEKGDLGYEYLEHLFAQVVAEERKFIHTYDGPR